MGTYMGLAFPLYSDTGALIATIASDGTVTWNTTQTFALNVASTTVQAGIEVSITSTGAIAALATLANGFQVTASSKANLNVAFMYDNMDVGTAQVNSAVSLLGVNGTKAPTSFLVIGNSKSFGEGGGAAESNGFFSITHRLTSSASISTITSFATIAVMSGSYVFYIPCYPNTMIT